MQSFITDNFPALRGFDKRNKSLGQAGSTDKVAFAAADPFLRVYTPKQAGAQKLQESKAALQGLVDAASSQQGPEMSGLTDRNS